MSSIKLRINGRELVAEYGKTILQIAIENDIYIPHLCWQEGLSPCGSCGVCVVSCEGKDRLLRSCAVKAEDGMVIETESDKAVEARTLSLSLLMNEHNGDCVAPCSLACPAGVDCQGFIRFIAKKDFKGAVRLIKEDNPFPASLSRLCLGACQLGCRRGRADHALEIQSLERYCADLDLASENPIIPECLPSNGKSIAIVGTSIAGLAAAYFLALRGFTVSVYDAMPRLGERLCQVMNALGAADAIDKEIALLEGLGITYKQTSLEDSALTEALCKEYDAALLAPMHEAEGDVDGSCESIMAELMGKPLPEKLYSVGKAEGKPEKALLHSVKNAKETALSIEAQLAGRMPGEKLAILSHRRDYKLLFKGKGIDLKALSQKDEVAAESEPQDASFDNASAQAEALRCLECGCKAFPECRLIQAANHAGELLSYEKEGEYAATMDRRLGVIEYDKDKCILCGQCIQYCNNIAGKRILDFSGRGNASAVNCEFASASDISGCKDCYGCVDVCPTGAMSLVLER